WTAPAPARRAPRPPASVSGRMTPTARRGRLRSPGRPTGDRSSWRISGRTTCRSSIWAWLSPINRVRRVRAFRSPGRRSPTEALLRGPIFVLGHAHFLLDLIERPALLREPADALEEQRVVFFAVFEDLHRAGHPVPGNDVERVQALHRLRRGEDVGNGHDGPEVVDLVDDDAGGGEEYSLLRQPH